VVGTHAVGEVDADRLIALMVGRELVEVFPERAGEAGEALLAVRNLTREGVLEDVSFRVHRGEILGLAGLMGAGRTELIRCLFGLDKYDRGQIVVGGRQVAINSPAEALRLGLGLVSEDRQITGLVPCLSLGINVTLSHLDQCSRGPVIARDQERVLVDRAVSELRIKAGGGEQRVSDLSGGNQQKVVLAKALLGAPDILLLDEPTRGIDVGTKAEIYELMRRLADAGKAIIMASSELEEVMGMSDRVLVLSGGRVAGELRGEETSAEAIMRYAMTN